MPSDSPTAVYTITLGGESSAGYAIDDVTGLVTAEAYVPVVESRCRAAAAFVTNLRERIGGQAPALVALMYWMGRYLAHESAMKITRGFAQSIRSVTGSEGPPHDTSLRIVCSDVKAVARRAAR